MQIIQQDYVYVHVLKIMVYREHLVIIQQLHVYKDALMVVLVMIRLLIDIV